MHQARHLNIKAHSVCKIDKHYMEQQQNATTPRERDAKPETCDKLGDKSNEKMVCATSKLIYVNEPDKFELTCNNCKQLVHYKCSKLTV